MANRVLGSFPTFNIAPWLNGGGPMQIPSTYRTVSTAAALPGDQRGTHHSAARLATIAGFVSSGSSKFRATGDFQSASPPMVTYLQSRLAAFKSRPVNVQNFAGAATDSFVDAVDGYLLFLATWAYRVGLDTTTALRDKVNAWMAAYIANTSRWDLLQRGTNGDYQFSCHKEAANIAAAYGLWRYEMSAGDRAAMQQQILRNGWYAIGQISYQHVALWFPNRLNDDYSTYSTGYFDYSYGGGNPYQYIHLGAKWDGSTKYWQIPLVAASFGNQWGQAMANASLAAALNPDRPELAAHVKRAFMEQIAFGCYPIGMGSGCLPAEVGIRAGDYGIHDQGMVYGSLLVNGCGIAAKAFQVSLSDTDLLDYTTSMGVMGAGGGTKSFARMVQSMLDCRSGVIQLASVDPGAALGQPATPISVPAYRRLNNFQTDPGKTPIDRCHEVAYLAWRELDSNIRADNYYKRAGDFAGLPMIGTSGNGLDSGNTYGNQYGVDLPVDPAVLFSYQDLLGVSVSPGPPPPTSTPTVPTIVSVSSVAGSTDFTARVYVPAGTAGTVWLENQNSAVTIADISLGSAAAGAYTTITRTGSNTGPDGVWKLKLVVGATTVRSDEFTLDGPFIGDVTLSFGSSGALASAPVFGHASITGQIIETNAGGGEIGAPLTVSVTVAGVATTIQTASALSPLSNFTVGKYYKAKLRDPNIGGANWAESPVTQYLAAAPPPPPPAVVEPTYSVAPLSISVPAGTASVALAISASSAVPGARTINISSSNPSVISATPASWTIPQGYSGATMQLTPGAAGTATLTVTVGNQTFTIPVQVTAVVAAPTIGTTTLPGGTVGTAYSQTLQGTSDTLQILWGATNLPPGLELVANGSGAAIAGTPTTAGSWTITITAANAGGTTSRSIPLTIVAQDTPNPPAPEPIQSDVSAWVGKTPDPKKQDDRLLYAIDFRPLLSGDETLVAPVLSVDLWPAYLDGPDAASMATMLSGGPQTLSNGVLQYVEGGQRGITYILSARAKTTRGVIVTAQLRFRVYAQDSLRARLTYV